jgi:general secretion pathway protein K
MRCSDADRAEKGIAVITVLWTLILMSIVAACLALETRTSSRIARNIAQNAAARAAADAGIQRVLLDLVAAPSGPASMGKFRADGTVYTWRFNGSTVHISIQDEASKIDLNQAPEAFLASLFMSVGADPDKAQSLADAIGDFRDPDNLVRPRGAEEAEYRAAGLSWGPKNAPFEAVEELKQVLGMTEALYERMAPHLTVYYLGGTMNPTLAGEQLSGVLSRAGFNPLALASRPGLVFSVRAEAEGFSGGKFVREAVVEPIPGISAPLILSWRAVTDSREALGVLQNFN